MLISDDTTDKRVLQDGMGHKTKKPWRKRKSQAIFVSGAFLRVAAAKRARGEKAGAMRVEKKALRVKDCGTSLVFKVGPDGSRGLHSANFCRVRLCPMCAWRKSLKVFGTVSQAMSLAVEKGLEPVFLTLTVRSCGADGLRDEIGRIFAGWHKAMNNKRVKALYPGWFRSLEVTHSKETGLYHPHVHAILLVEKRYFKSKGYMTAVDWSKLWKKAMRLGYDPVCDIRKVKGPDTAKAAAEVSKYTVKASDYIFSGKGMDNVLETLESSLRGKRLYAFGGLMRGFIKLAESMGAGDPESVAGPYMLEQYLWDFVIANYILARVMLAGVGGHESV